MQLFNSFSQIAHETKRLLRGYLVAPGFSVAQTATGREQAQEFCFKLPIPYGQGP